MAITSIPQHEVTRTWKNMVDYCKERDCYSSCEEDCNLKKARSYLRGFTKNGRDVNKGLEEVEFEKTDRSFDKKKIKEFLEQIEDLCQECGAYHV